MFGFGANHNKKKEDYSGTAESRRKARMQVRKWPMWAQDKMGKLRTRAIERLSQRERVKRGLE